MWLESHANLARHPKARRLMKLLGWSLPDTIGNLHLFWWWALDFAPTGDLTRYTPEELTADLDLLGTTPDQFIESMIQAGFLDRTEEGILCIHDWVEHGPQGAVRVDCVEDTARQGAGSGRDRSQYKRPKPRRAPASAARHPKSVEPESRDSSREGSVEKTTRNNVLAPEQIAPTNAVRDPQLLAPPRRNQPNELSTRGTDTPNVEARDSHSPASSATGETPPPQELPQSAVPTNAAEALEIREELPANLYRLPGFAKHWWPLYIDFHKKAGTPLSTDARAKFLARLEKEPLTAIAQIKRTITQAVHNGTPWTGLLEHAP